MVYGSIDKNNEGGGGGNTSGRSRSEGGIEDGRAPAQAPDKLPLIWTSDHDDTQRDNKKSSGAKEGGHYNIFHYLIYALINVIIGKKHSRTNFCF